MRPGVSAQGSAHVYSLLDGLEEKAVQKRESAGICVLVGRCMCCVLLTLFGIIMFMGLREEQAHPLAAAGADQRRQAATFDASDIKLKPGNIDEARRARLEHYVLKSQQEQYKASSRIHLSCHSPGFLHFVGRMQIGESVTVICPKECYANPWVEAHAPLVWGTSVYTDNSMICLAALHATGVDGAVYRVSIAKGQTRYIGSSKHRVETADYGEHQRSFSIKYVGKGMKISDVGKGMKISDVGKGMKISEAAGDT
eukprot:g2861.t1